MVPIHLDWQRPLDGVELLFDDETVGPEGIISARSNRLGPVSYRVIDLENPVAIALLNSKGEKAICEFVSRFGIPNPRGFSTLRSRCPMGLIRALQEDIEELFSLSEADNPTGRAAAINQLLQYTSLKPTFEQSDKKGGQCLVIRPSTLEDLMMMECAYALDVGVKMTRCAKCSKAFLTGPRTGRRSHATYCSDRCRVAAMRARNAEKGQ